MKTVRRARMKEKIRGQRKEEKGKARVRFQLIV
jgi:hypothetical protein